MKIWEVQTPYVARYFDNERKAENFYNGCERASIRSYSIRKQDRIRRMMEIIAKQQETEDRFNDEKNSY